MVTKTREGPLAKVSVEIGGFSDEEDESTGYAGMTTDADGRRTILLRPGARYALRSDHPGFQRAERTVLAPPAGSELVETLLLDPLEPPKRVLSIRLLAKDGEAGVERAEVRLSAPTEAATDDWGHQVTRVDGRFAVKDPPAGLHRLTVKTAGEGEMPYLATSQDVEIAEKGVTSVDVRLALGGWLVLGARAPDGRLLEPRCRVLDDKGAARARFFLVRHAAGSMGHSGKLSPSSLARVEPALPAGTYVVELSDDAFEDVRVEAVVREGQTTTLEIPMTPR